MIQYRGPPFFRVAGGHRRRAWFDRQHDEKDMVLAHGTRRKLNVPVPHDALTNEFLTAARAWDG